MIELLISISLMAVSAFVMLLLYIAAELIAQAYVHLITKGAEFIATQLLHFKFFRKSSFNHIKVTLMFALFTLTFILMVGIGAYLSDIPLTLDVVRDTLVSLWFFSAPIAIGVALMILNYIHNQRLYKIFLPRYWFGDTTENAIIPTQTHDLESISTLKATQKDAPIVSVDKNIIRQIALVWLKPEASKAPTDAMNFALSCRYLYALLHHDLRDPYIKRLLTHTLNGNHDGIRDVLTISPKLLLLRGSIFDGQGNTIDQVTAYQLTYLRQSGKDVRQTLKPFFHQIDRVLDKSLYQQQMKYLTTVNNPAEQESLKQHTSNLTAYAQFYDKSVDDHGNAIPSEEDSSEEDDALPLFTLFEGHAQIPVLASSSTTSPLVRFHLLKNTDKILDKHPHWSERKKDQFHDLAARHFYYQPS